MQTFFQHHNFFSGYSWYHCKNVLWTFFHRATWAPGMCLYCILILRFTDFALTSVRCCLLSQGGIHCFVLFPALLYDLFCHCQRCLSDPKRSAWQNKLPSTTPSLYTLPVTPLRSNHLRPKTPDLDRATFSSLLFFVFFFFSFSSLNGHRNTNRQEETGGWALQRGLCCTATPDRQQQRQQSPLYPWLSNCLSL